MKSEFKHFTRVNQNLALIVEDLRLRHLGLKNESLKLAEKLKKQEDIKKKNQSDLQEMILTCNTDKKLKQGIVNLHKECMQEDNRKREHREKGSLKEQFANRDHYESANSQLKQKIKTTSKNHKEKNARILKDNVDLINQINALKKERHVIQQKIKEIGFTIKELEQAGVSSGGRRPPRMRAKSARVGSSIENQFKEV